MRNFIFGFIILLILIIGSWYTPWSQPQAMITVTGTSQQLVNNQLAGFQVSVTQTDKNKDTALSAVNQAMAEIVQAVKDFGIESKDITTQNVSVYEVGQPEILIYPPRPNSDEPQWQASNSLSIILRQVDKASALTDLLQNFELAQVSGPNFSLDQSSDNDDELLVKAVDNAREKAAKVAAASGRKLGKVITVSESGGVYPVYRGMMLEAKDSVAAPVEPGSSEMTKSVTVVFELK